jgi:hypothetical protein
MAVMAVAGLARTGVKIARAVGGEERWKKLNKVRFLRLSLFSMTY